MNTYLRSWISFFCPLLGLALGLWSVRDPFNIPVGTKVVGTNQDGATHTVTGNASNTFASTNIKQNTMFSTQFGQMATYPYHCKIHPFMAGTIVVK
jgi:plastocyanin